MERRKNLIIKIKSQLTNAIFHQILISGADNEELKIYYQKEIDNSMNTATFYRKKLEIKFNSKFNLNDEIQVEIVTKALKMVAIRQKKGYKVDENELENTISEFLKKIEK